MQDVGFKLNDLGVGWCETTLALLTRHMQQNNFAHGGVLATMADHTAGAASSTIVKESEIVLTVEFKINLLRPAVGDSLRCKAQVLRAGKTIIVTESEVYAIKDGDEKLCAKAMLTFAVVGKDK
jgi:uncharacterized protein (TIGR00369 family)